jgi:hypothetical protein
MLRQSLIAALLSLLASVVHAQWQLMPGKATDIGVGGRGGVWAIGVDRVPGGSTIYRWTGSEWQVVPGGAVRIDVDSRGNPWVVNTEGKIFRRAAGGWQPMPGLARDIGVGANDAVWVIGINAAPGGYEIHRWSGKEWTRMPGGAVRIDVDPKGNAWVVNDRGEVLRFERGSWQRMSGSAAAVTVAADGKAWVLGTDRVQGGYSVQQWTGRDWRRVDGGAVALSAGPVPWLVNEGGQIYRWGK